MEKERIAQQNRRIRVDHIKFGGGSVCACGGREGCVICGWQNLHSQHAVALAAVTVVLIDIRKVFTWFFFYLYPHLLLSILYLSNLFSPSFQFPNNKFFSMMRTPRMNQKICGYFGTLKYKFFFLDLFIIFTNLFLILQFCCCLLTTKDMFFIGCLFCTLLFY